eukprot:gene12323-16528_t
MSIDIEHIESLIEKVSCTNLNAALRASTNLQFKISSGILPLQVFSSIDILNQLSDSIYAAIARIIEGTSTEVLNNFDSVQSKLLNSLLLIIERMGNDATSKLAVNGLTKILDKLYHLTTIHDLDERLISLLEKSIQSVCTIPMRESENIQDVSFRSQSLRVTALIQNEQAIPHNENNISKPKNTIYRGAGAILNSSIVFHGWKFPNFVIVDSDERYLFDVEVKLKLSHSDSMKLLWDVVYDFPVEAIITKTGLIHTVLDVVGSTYSTKELDSDPNGVHPISAIRWLQYFIQKCCKAFKIILNGSMCANIPSISVKVKDTNRLISDTVDVNTAETASKMAHTMYAMRYPLITLHINQEMERQRLVEEQKRNIALGTISLSPVPSFPGLAFACCAAALPLIQTKDPSICQHVVSLVLLCLPYVVEPTLNTSEESLIDNKSRLRLQHLLNRIDQIISAISPIQFDADDFYLIIFDDNVDKINSDNESSSNDMGSYSFDVCFLCLFINIIKIMPVNLIKLSSIADDIHQKDNTESSQALFIGENILQVILQLFASKIYRNILPEYEHLFYNILFRVHPEKVKSIESTKSKIRSMNLFANDFDRLKINAEERGSYLVTSFFIDNLTSVLSLLDEDYTFHLPMETDNIISAIPLLLCSSLNMKEKIIYDSVSALVLRVLTCSHITYRAQLFKEFLFWLEPSLSMQSNNYNPFQLYFMKILNISSTSIRKHLIKSISEHSIVQALLFTIINNCNSNDDLALSTLFSHGYRLLEHIIEYLLSNNNTKESIGEWCEFLSPLKLISWESSKRIENKTNKLLLEFIQIIENYCIESSNLQCQNLYGHSLLMGIFYSDKSVSLESTMKIADYVQNNSDLNLQVSSEDGLVFETIILSNWSYHTSRCKLESPSTKSKTHRMTSKFIETPPMFTHADARKLAAIAFGEMEISLRISSLNQLNEILASPNIVSTADISWLLAILQSSINSLDLIANIHNNYQVLSASQCKFISLSANLFSFIIINVSGIRKYIQLVNNKNENNKMLSLSIPMRILLLSIQNITTSHLLNTLHEVKYYVVQALWVICFSSDLWLVSLGNMLNNYDSHESKFELKEIGKEAVLKPSKRAIIPSKIPSFIKDYFCFPLQKSDSFYTSHVNSTLNFNLLIDSNSANAYAPEWIIETRFKCRIINDNEISSYPTPDIIDILYKESKLANNQQILLGTTAKLFESIIYSDNHAALQHSLRNTACFGISYPGIYHQFLILNISLLTALSNIFTNQPKTVKDYLSLSYSLHTIDNALVEIKSANFNPEIISFINQTAELLIPFISIYFINQKELRSKSLFNSYLDNELIEDEIKEMNAAKYAVEIKMLNFLLTLTEYDHEELCISTAVIGTTLLSQLINNYILREAIHSHLRTTAINIVLNIVSKHDGFYILTNSNINMKNNNNRNKSDNELTSLLLQLIRIVKLLRYPDSLQSKSVIVKTLQLIHTLLTYYLSNRVIKNNEIVFNVDHYSSWLVRLIYDRNIEIKLLALEIVRIILGQNATQTIIKSNDDNDTKDSLETIIEDSSWPPYQHIDHIIKDATESKTARCLAISIMIDNIIINDISTGESSPKLTKLPVLLDCISSCLHAKDEMNDLSTIHHSLQSLMRLLQYDISLSPSSTGLPIHIKNMKILPKIVELCNPHISHISNKLIRIGLINIDNYLYSDNSTNLELVSSSFPSELMNSGWMNLIIPSKINDWIESMSVQTLALQLIHMYSIIDENALIDILDHSRLLTYFRIMLIEPFIEPIEIIRNELDKILCNYIIQMEFLSLLLIRDGKMNLDFMIQIASTHHDVKEIVQKILNRILSLVQLILDLLLSNKYDLNAIKYSQICELSIKLLSTICRVICCMLDKQSWREIFGIHTKITNTVNNNNNNNNTDDNDYDDEKIKSNDIHDIIQLFSLLIINRKVLKQCSINNINDFHGISLPQLNSIISNIDITISLFMQYSDKLKSYLYSHEFNNKYTINVQNIISKSNQFVSDHDYNLDEVENSKKNKIANNNKLSKSHSKSDMNLADDINHIHTSLYESNPQPVSGSNINNNHNYIIEHIMIIRNAVDLLFTSKHEVSSKRSTNNGLKSNSNKSNTISSNNKNKSVVNGKENPYSQEKWRERARSYKLGSNGSIASTNAMSVANHEMSDTFKLQLWTSLVVLSNACKDSPQTLELLYKLKLHISLNKLMKLASAWSIFPNLNTQITIDNNQYSDTQSNYSNYSYSKFNSNISYSSTILKNHKENNNNHIISNGNIAAAIYMLCCSFIQESNQSKLYLLNSGEAIIQNKSYQNNNDNIKNGNGNIFYQLLSIGVTKSMLPITRQIALRISLSLISTLNASSRSGIAQVAVISLQRFMHNKLLTTTYEAICLLQKLSLLLKLSNNYIFTSNSQLTEYEIKNFDLLLPKEYIDTKLISLPDLIAWMFDESKGDVSVHIAICRCFGQISMAQDSTGVGNRSILSYIVSEPMMRILLDGSNSSNVTLRTIALTALWNITHKSEKAKIIVRNLRGNDLT